MSVTIIVEITNKLLRRVSTHEVSSSGSSLVIAKITFFYNYCNRHLCAFVGGIKNNKKMHGTTIKVVQL